MTMRETFENEDDFELETQDTEKESERSEADVEASDGSTDTTDAGDTGDGDAAPQKIISGLKKRIAKLTAAKNEGRVAKAERDALQARLKAFEDAEAARKAAEAEIASQTPAAIQAAERRRAIREAIDQAYGPGASEFLESQRDAQALQKEQYALNAINYLKAELEKNNLATDEKTLVRWERAIGSEIAEDSDLLARFRRPTTLQSAIADAFKLVNEGLVAPAAKTTTEKTGDRISRNRDAVLGGGRTSSSAGAPDIDWNPQPPKGLRGEQLEQWWKDQGEKLRLRLESEQL